MIRHVIRICIGLLFLVSGTYKCFHTQAFIETVHSYRILPERIDFVFAVIIMVGETVSGLSLIVNWIPRIWYSLLLIFLTLFIFAIIKILSESSSVDCGCLTGIYSETVSSWMLVRNALLISIIVWLLRTNISGKDSNDISDRNPG